VKNNLVRKTSLDFADLEPHNKFMSLKLKKNKKLKATELKKIKLEESEDSSLSESE